MISRKIRIFSDSNDISVIKSAVEQVKLNGINPRVIHLRNFVLDKNDILIFHINDINSKYLNKISSIKEQIDNNLIFVVQENNAVLVSSLAKLGIGQIFVLPYEVYSFISHIQDIFQTYPFKVSENLSKQQSEKLRIDALVGKSEAIKRITILAQKIAENTLSNILIRGETGTGKGLLAKIIHDYGRNSSGPFIEIVCSSLPDSLLESELFGYEEGAFTNAQNTKQGLFELAENGTVFLDEIGDLSINVQRKLLRVIEKKVIRHLGSVTDTPVNARIIASTNMNLEEMVENNQFRDDLYHRLNVVSIELPPLRDRGEDIIILAERFINEFSEQFNKEIPEFSNEVKEYLLNYNWPGNVRELRNAVERAVLLTNNKILQIQDFVSIIGKRHFTYLSDEENNDLYNMIYLQLDHKKIKLSDLDKIYAKELYKKLLRNKTKTAAALGISRPKLDSLLK